MNSVVAFHVEAVQCLARKMLHPHLEAMKARPKNHRFYQPNQIVILKEFKEASRALLFQTGKGCEDSSLHTIIIPMPPSIP